MTTCVYENLFLVNNIPKIEGMYQVRDMIKNYAYIGEIYMIIDMNNAKQHARIFKYVHIAIIRAYSRTNLMECKHTTSDECIYCLFLKERDPEEQSWVWGFDRFEYEDKWQHCIIIDDDSNKYPLCFLEETQLQSANCYLCGEYIPYFVNHWYNIPYCSCQHNDHYYDDAYHM